MMRRRYRRGRTLLNFCILLLFLSLKIHGRQVNVTIDDQFGDPTTGQVIQYNPAEAWNKGQDCEACTAKPRPINRAHNSTWMDGSFFPTGTGTNGVSGQIISASVPFIGTAVYVRVILTRSRSFPTGNSDFTFSIDNETSGVFQQAPNGDTSYQFNQTIFSKSGLSNSLHTLTIESGHGGNQSLVLLDSVIYTKEVPGSSNSTDDANPNPDSESSSSSNIGVIVGPVVGGVIVAGAIVALIFFLRRRRQHQQGQRVRVLLDAPPMEAVSSARRGSGPGTDLGRNHPASIIDPFITNEHTPYNHANSSGFYAAPAHNVSGPDAAASQTALSFADPVTHAGPSEPDATSLHPTTSRGIAEYGRVDESRIDSNTALSAPPAYSEIESSVSSDVSRLPNPHSKQGLRLA